MTYRASAKQTNKKSREASKLILTPLTNTIFQAKTNFQEVK